MYELIRHEIKIAQSTWQIYGWETEMKALKAIYEGKNTSYWLRIQKRVILNGKYGK